MKFRLEIVTPFGMYFNQDIDFLNLSSTKGMLGILPNHTPLISDVLLGEIVIRNNGEDHIYATSGGLIKITKEKTILLLDTIESIHDIDIKRAEDAKKRAMDRLNHKENIDIARAMAALDRAINRLKIASKKTN